MEQLGWSESKARMVEDKYHVLYRVSDQWVADRIEEAGKVGYVTVAFGLKVRTPLLRQVILGTSRTPYEAAGEGRTAGNALGQSYCMLNNRAQSAFLKKVRASEFRLDVRPCAPIHDATYYMIPDDMRPLLYVNETLVPEVQWQEDPAIWHEDVKLGGEVSVFYPSWAEEMTIPNGASADDVKALAAKHHDKYC